MVNNIRSSHFIWPIPHFFFFLIRRFSFSRKWKSVRSMWAVTAWLSSPSPWPVACSRPSEFSSNDSGMKWPDSSPFDPSTKLSLNKQWVEMCWYCVFLDDKCIARQGLKVWPGPAGRPGPGPGFQVPGGSRPRLWEHPGPGPGPGLGWLSPGRHLSQTFNPCALLWCVCVCGNVSLSSGSTRAHHQYSASAAAFRCRLPQEKSESSKGVITFHFQHSFNSFFFCR